MKNYPLYPAKYYDTFPEFIDGLEREYADRPAISYFNRRKEETCFTFGEFVKHVRGLQEMLAELGLAGRHIAIAGENSYDWLVAFVAIAGCGGVAVCIDAEQSDETIYQMAKMADVEAIFVSEPYIDICKPLLGKDAPVKQMFVLNAKEAGSYQSLQALAREGAAKLDNGPGRAFKVDPDQGAEIAFTSGTTSLSKPVMLSHRNILHNIADSIAYVDLGRKIFTALPFYHTYGLTCTALGALARGAHLYINGDLKTAMRDLQLAQPDSMLTVPLMLEAIHNQIWLSAEKAGKAEGLRKLMSVSRVCRKMGLPWRSSKLDEIREKAVGRLKIVVSGGAHLDSEIADEFALLGLTMLQGYGITECSPLIAVNRNKAFNTGSVGYIMPGCEVKIEQEEIWVRGVNVMKGYYNNPQQTAEVMEGEWFKTGDMGYLDKDGHLFITGRKKNLVVFKNGNKVSPEKIEEMIHKIPLVKDVLVYGAASGASADDVKLAASIYPDPERAQGLSSYEILEQLQSRIDQINAMLPLYQQVQMVNIREQPFAKTGTQKIKRY